jgi:hypothetical protein
MAAVIISGALANKPFNGGNAWTRLSWVQGFQQLGFRVYFVEEIRAEDCINATGAAASFEDSINLAYFRETMDRFGLAGASALICSSDDRTFGMSLLELRNAARNSCLLFNLSGHLKDPELRSLVSCRVYYDDDPGFTQFWHAAGERAPGLEGHDFYYTLGSNIGSPECIIPTVGIPWRHTRPPVVLQEWPLVPRRFFDRFTTVASWRGAYGPVQYRGMQYGVKAHEFRKFIELPRRTQKEFEIALQIHSGDHKDLQALQAAGWNIRDPRSVAATPDEFRTYVQTSSAEFSAAQGVYVGTNSGWVSDRTVRYLASGRPALVQDTGLSQQYPVGQGLLTFRTFEEAADGAERITREYDRHCRAARQMAEAYFDAHKVVGQLAAEIGLKPPARSSTV